MCGLLYLASFTFHNVLRFLHVAGCARISLLFMAEYYSILWLYHMLFIHSLTDEHLSGFQLLAMVSSTIKNISMEVFVQIPVFNSSKYISRNRTAGSYPSLGLNFRGTTQLFSTALALFYIPNENM